MGWFTKNKQDRDSITTNEVYPSNEEPIEDTVPIPRDKFILETKTLTENYELPIYGIYNRFQEDWETRGYKDAIAFPETSYRENQKRVIIDKLRLFIKEALLRYDDKITDIDSLIHRATQNGLIETLELYKQERLKLVAHREELDILDKDAREVGEKTKPILLSYDMGFTKGMVALSNDKVKKIMNKNEVD